MLLLLLQVVAVAVGVLLGNIRCRTEEVLRLRRCCLEAVVELLVGVHIFGELVECLEWKHQRKRRLEEVVV